MKRLLLYLISMLFENGFIYLISFIISYLYLIYCQVFRKRRFDLYDAKAIGQPEKNGFFIPSKEWELDAPRKSIPLDKFSDDAFIFGANSKAESLAIHVARIPNNEVRCSLALRLQNGKVYYLPKENVIQRASTEDFTFGSSRLKLQCLAPMRRWRVFFNGILKECSDEDLPFSEKYKHVKFTLLWAASTDVFDFSTDMSKTLISHSAANATSWTLLPTTFLKRISSTFDRYEQGGMLQGTVKIENEPETEIYLWGSRGRFLGNVSDLQDSRYTEVYGHFKAVGRPIKCKAGRLNAYRLLDDFFKLPVDLCSIDGFFGNRTALNGTTVHFGMLTIPGVKKRFVYGYMMRATGFVYPVDELEEEISGTSAEVTIAKLHAGGKRYDITIESIVGGSTNLQEEYSSSKSVKIVKLFTNHNAGSGFIFEGIATESDRLSKKECFLLQDTLKQFGMESSLTIPFNKERCQLVDLCGGKGSSLGKLFTMAKRSETDSKYSKFTVPNGIVVSTVSYEEFIKANLLDSHLKTFEKVVWSKSQDIQQLCQKTVQTISKCMLPEEVMKSIARDLKAVFGDSFFDLRFAVRSSATGEDTEQMSAAGQMETFLGLSGLDQIYESVVKCWASQFTFQAVEYKRRYGQCLNTAMGVVIQEMVACDAAGVIFTCDPFSGNPLIISITANWGLGESVVSGKAEPDTITLQRDLHNRLKFHSTCLGKKALKIIMDDTGTKETKVENLSTYCISEAESLKLGQIAIEIENEYGSSRDLEWGIVGGNVFLFQSRPVTSLDMETDFEIEHCFDTALRCEREIMSRVHIGEDMPGAMSPLGCDFFHKLINLRKSRTFLGFDVTHSFPDKPYFEKGMMTASYTLFFSLISGFMKFDEKNKDLTKGFMIACFGRLIDDKEIRELALERYEGVKEPVLKNFLKIPYLIVVLHAFDVYCRWVFKRNKNFHIPCKDTISAHETLLQISTHYDRTSEIHVAHFYNSVSSVTWNLAILTSLVKTEGAWNNKVLSEFAYLMSTCTQVESANVPASIQELALTISKNSDFNSFKKMDIEEALKFLQSDSSQVGKKFEEFLQRHGHRCLKEIDVYSEVWKTNPRSLVKTLQAMWSRSSETPVEKKIDSMPVIFSNLKIKLDFLGRLKLRWALPNARKAVRWREHSKAFFINMINHTRIPLNHMAEQMVLEGRLPCKEHFFFLSIEEIRQLSERRYPRLVTRAAWRYKCFQKMDNFIFPEITCGIPKPINEEEKIPIGNGYCMTGVPISQGIVKARACIAKNIKEAANIKAGDILITYSTDIAWSPYFPLLAGIVTELGGLVSHGAVVAREFGLPCVIALHGATRAFTSGDIVVLDGNKGTLQKVEE